MGQSVAKNERGKYKISCSKIQEQDIKKVDLNQIRFKQVELGPDYFEQRQLFSKILESYRVVLQDYDKCLIDDEITKSGQSFAPAKRIQMEFKQLKNNLPVEISNSIFCTQNQKNQSHLRSLVTGPQDTPYAFGCFLFDIYLKDNYPNNPPEVKLLTTNGGNFRFNPNLYKNGKVCLSLLGTWQGSLGEKWSASTSNIYQVLVSIQSLIMGEGVAYKEPGYNGFNKSDQIIRQNYGYENIVKLATINYGMIDVLQNPPKDFKEVIELYFYANEEIIKRQIEIWIEESITPQPPVPSTIKINAPLLNKKVVYTVSKNPTLAEMKTIKLPQVEDGKDFEKQNQIYYKVLEGSRINVLDYSSILPGITAKTNVTALGAKRINKEITQLAKNLPIDKRNSIFCTQNSKQLSHLRSVITGPKNTPYAFGCFLFDIQCNESYPNKPPTVLSQTTGGGTIRFNPNLYKAGKVCLSLLGTWSGTGGENWTQNSNIYQVLVSIQSLIMGDGIAYKEPGYGPSSVDLIRQNQGYENIIKVCTIQYAMVEMLKNPPKDFVDVIQMHFFLNKDIIMRQIQVWIDDSLNPKIKPLYSGICSSQNYNMSQKFTAEKQYHLSLVEQKNQLQEEFNKLDTTILKNKIYIKYQKEINDISKSKNEDKGGEEEQKQKDTKQSIEEEIVEEIKIETNDEQKEQEKQKKTLQQVNKAISYSPRKSIKEYIIQKKQEQQLNDAQKQIKQDLEKQLKKELEKLKEQQQGQKQSSHTILNATKKLLLSNNGEKNKQDLKKEDNQGIGKLVKNVSRKRIFSDTNKNDKNQTNKDNDKNQSNKGNDKKNEILINEKDKNTLLKSQGSTPAKKHLTQIIKKLDINSVESQKKKANEIVQISEISKQDLQQQLEKQQQQYQNQQQIVEKQENQQEIKEKGQENKNESFKSIQNISQSSLFQSLKEKPPTDNVIVFDDNAL
ncbi:Ubiquitin-conjugating enzyme/RWD-like protein [Pseudocohnilembus persalinus]|uniref:Ubiquitin-conjugating enzyme/RWD-like protein n=1 Tax=Pseudocohnilembus persalinus TaxID=266149 RepID=A0A0V0QGX7_PSEPJ|nr:Ubiquitin-conjugating enzyme/RWD-like protein [Pseudocohnilembus persalinus]|eukprot:KRX01455.1 Ubiquitin-conjugating enzyme/RWD-like protein [Pseudocohnilembus persalinus]